MTTFTTFTPSGQVAFHFTPTLDGTQYIATVPWNLFGQRYYITIAQQDGTPVVTKPATESPVGVAIEALSWNLSTGLVTVTTTIPHGFGIGDTVVLTISGCAPDAYNGLVGALITGPSAFAYPLATDPGAASTFGAASQDIDILAGYFASTLVYRNGNFEVSP